VAQDGAYKRRPLPQQSRALTTWVGLTAFAREPGVPLRSRIKNLCLLTALFVLPLPLRLRLERATIL
jgi:hypothetical protein